MPQTVLIKLKNAGPRVGPFTIKDNLGNTLATDVSRDDLKNGVSYSVDDNATAILMSSTGAVALEKSYSINALPTVSFTESKFAATAPSGNTPYLTEQVPNPPACVWRHLKNPLIYNTFYGIIEPYIIEYPFSYKLQDQILRSVKDYTKVYKYLDTGDGVLSDFSKVETDDVWFNKAILYNGQQSSGILNLVPKPKNSLAVYGTYPIYNTDSKDILVTKNDNFYQYNTFWNVQTDVAVPSFTRTCESLSIDKEINQNNMDYSIKSFKKATMRAKDLKVRHILDDRSDAKLVSQFVLTSTQVSHK